jgi:hypothetical protein
LNKFDKAIMWTVPGETSEGKPFTNLAVHPLLTQHSTRHGLSHGSTRKESQSGHDTAEKEGQQQATKSLKYLGLLLYGMVWDCSVFVRRSFS